jgi:arabinose-5-phosphate isomerase
MGKAGLVGQKIAATFSSTGTPAFVLHPVEAMHGDLGMVQAQDVVLALTNSGQTEEVIRTLGELRKMDCKRVLISGNPQSACARLCDLVLNIGQLEEACPLGLAPSSSTTAMLILGDLLALTVMFEKDFRREQYARFHPGGELGRSLMKVGEVMRSGAACPLIESNKTVRDYATAVQSAGAGGGKRGSGAVAVVDDKRKLVGFFTDGDLRRLIGAQEHPAAARLIDVMTRDPKYVRENDYVVAAAKVMRKYGIDELPVVDNEHRCVGMLDIQDLLAAGFTVFDDA